MPTLDWIGKKAVINHHHQVPYHLLKDVPELSVGDPGTGNLIVEGDNLLALKALLPYYAGQVKCIYIDPPYNTGNEGWVYNDNVNSPLIRDWLGKTVGKEAEDLSRHDKWLCMMYPRLAILRQFLTDDGVMLVSLDDVELGPLKLLMDEIFGKTNALGTIVWNTRNTDNRIKTQLSPDHEYILVYGRTTGARIEGRIIDRSDFKNPDMDPRGPYVTDPLTGKATAEERPNLHAYDMVQPGTTKTWKPDPAHGWITDEDGYNLLLKQNRIWWPASPKSGRPRKKRFLSETRTRMPASSFWTEFRSQSGANDLDEILTDRLFAFPKPISVVQRIVDYCAPPGSLVLDSYAGSGSTAHAVLKQNAEDGGNRRFILVEMEPKIARDITAERVKRVAQGYANPKGETVAGLGGGFRYCRLGEPLFNQHGQIREEVSFGDLARHVYFTETGEPLPEVDAASPPRPREKRGGEERRGGDAASTYFDLSQPVGFLCGGNLPHWRQPGATYFVTWRTADSMPEERVKQWTAERDEWLAKHPEPRDERTKAEYDRLFPERWERWLDECHGACELRRSDAKTVVEGALRHYDGGRYRLVEFAIMPNHVHVVVVPQGEQSLSDIIQNWKSFTAHEINRLLDRQGTFWQKESFDHIVRDASAMERICAYVRAQQVDAASPPRPRKKRGGDAASTPLIGICRGVAVYLLYNGILGDHTTNGGNVLTRAILARLPPHDGPKIIYGAGCLLGTDRLRDEGITFRQTPYEVRVS